MNIYFIAVFGAIALFNLLFYFDYVLEDKYNNKKSKKTNFLKWTTLFVSIIVWLTVPFLINLWSINILNIAVLIIVELITVLPYILLEIKKKPIKLYNFLRKNREISMEDGKDNTKKLISENAIYFGVGFSSILAIAFIIKPFMVAILS